MAVLSLAPAAEFERVRALGGIARVLLDIRLVCGVLGVGWVVLAYPDRPSSLAAVGLLAGWQLLILLRWEQFGTALSSHPALLAVDAAVCLLIVHSITPVSPLLLLLVTSAILSGLCLGRRGAMAFSPALVVGWFVVMLGHPGLALASPEGYVAWVIVPVSLVGALFLGAGIRRVVLDAAAGERHLRDQTRLAGIAEERARLAREMHDSLVKTLHGVVLLADSLPGWVTRDAEKASALADRIGAQLQGAAAESRELLVAMRRTQPTDPFDAQVDQAVQRWRSVTGRSAAVSVEGTPDVATDVGYELLAVLNEALENVSRHTPEETVARVGLTERNGWVELRIADDGPGAEAGLNGPSGRPGHFGVVGIRERAARVGGSARFTSEPGRGTEVVVRVPTRLPDDMEEW